MDSTDCTDFVLLVQFDIQKKEGVSNESLPLVSFSFHLGLNCKRRDLLCRYGVFTSMCIIQGRFLGLIQIIFGQGAHACVLRKPERQGSSPLY